MGLYTSEYLLHSLLFLNWVVSLYDPLVTNVQIIIPKVTTIADCHYDCIHMFGGFRCVTNYTVLIVFFQLSTFGILNMIRGCRLF